MSDTEHSGEIEPPGEMPPGCGKPLGRSGYIPIYCGSVGSRCRTCTPAFMAWRDRYLAAETGRRPDDG